MFVFVPTPPPPSPEAVLLGKKIAEAIRILRQENPAIRRGDVRRGLQLAEAELRAELGGPDPKVMLVAAGLVALLVGGVVAFLFASGSMTGGSWRLIVTIGAGVVALGVLAAIAIARR